MNKAQRRVYALARRHHDNAVVLIAAMDALDDGEITKERFEELTELIEKHPKGWRWADHPEFMNHAFDRDARQRICIDRLDVDRIFGTPADFVEDDDGD